MEENERFQRVQLATEEGKGASWRSSDSCLPAEAAYRTSAEVEYEIKFPWDSESDHMAMRTKQMLAKQM